jgi:4-amino-4-deoxy-L-arabinose transferase-like glycosyltransferase
LNQPSPALIAQSAVRRLPRLALLLFCVAYVLPGLVGRGPWKNADITAFGVMQQMAAKGSDWLQPNIMGFTVDFDGLLPYWIGALAIKLMPFLDPALAARLPYIGLLALTLVATWYAVYYLARSPQAQPVAFAFGGEASPADYARAIADAGLLALLACLGLAQLSHETTPAMAQLGFMTLMFYSVAASPYRSPWHVFGPGSAFVLGMVGLALSGAPTVAVLLGIGSVLVEWAHRRWGGESNEPPETRGWMLLMLGATLATALLVDVLDLWVWRIDVTALSQSEAHKEWGSIIRLLLWFPWPAWPLALWTLFCWRRQLTSRHVALPLWFAVVAVGTTLLTGASDRSLLLGLPPLATLAAFALPTLRRSVASLIDWFTLLFFTSCAIIIWVIWVAMQTGVPEQPAANVAKLAPGFEPSFSALAFGLALLATLAWAWLVKWRAGQQRAAIWKSLILPAGGTTLCWLLLMTLWLPLLDFARSYESMSKQVAWQVNRQACVEVLGLNTAQIAALRYHQKLNLRPTGTETHCPYLLVDTNSLSSMWQTVNRSEWERMIMVRRPADRNENVVVYRRFKPSTTTPSK